MNSYKHKSNFLYALHTVIIILFLKIFTELMRFLSTKFEFLDNFIFKIGKIDGIFRQASKSWYPQLDNLFNLLILIIFFVFLINKKQFNKNLKIDINLIIMTTFLSVFVFSSNILVNEYRGWDLALYCEINPIYINKNPYLIDVNGLTAVYSPLIWNIIYSVCKYSIFNNLIFPYYIWIYTGISFFFVSLIRQANSNILNVCINLCIVLSFLGTNYSGLITGNIGYVVGVLIAYCFVASLRNPNNKFISFIFGLLLLFKPFFIFWFVLIFLFNKVFKNEVILFYNLRIVILTQIFGNLLNLFLYRVEYLYFIENILQLNNSINKPLNDEAGFLNMIFQDYIYRVFEKTFQIEINKIILIFISIILLFVFKKYFKKLNQIITLPIFLTPRFKAYDLTFLYIIFNKKEIALEYLLFCTLNVSLLIIFAISGVGYLTELVYILIFVLYIVLLDRQNN